MTSTTGSTTIYAGSSSAIATSKLKTTITSVRSFMFWDYRTSADYDRSILGRQHFDQGNGQDHDFGWC